MKIKNNLSNVLAVSVTLLYFINSNAKEVGNVLSITPMCFKIETIPLEDSLSLFKEKTLQLIKKSSPEYISILNANFCNLVEMRRFVDGVEIKNNVDYSDSAVLSLFNTTVHESIHKYNSSKMILVSPEETHTVDLENYCSTKSMTSYFESKCATDSIFRFDTYIKNASNILVSNNYGIIGLLDEYSAYYHSTNTSYSLYRVFLAEGELDYAKELKSQLLASYYAYYEFELFIGGYLSYLKEYKLDLYQETINNESIKKVYSGLHDSFKELEESIVIEFKDDSLFNYFEKKYVKSTRMSLLQFEVELELLRS